MQKQACGNLPRSSLFVAIDKAIKEAVRDALIRHKRAGVPIVIWKDGKVVRVPPEEIVVDESGSPPEPPIE